MVKFTLYDKETAPEGSKKILEHLHNKNGMIPNLYAVMAESPVVLESYLRSGQSIDKTSFSTLEKHVIWLAVNAANNCHYCMAIHTLAAKNQKIPESVIHALRNGDPVADNKLETLRQFTEILVKNRGWASGEDISNFIEAGYTKAQILELILMISHKTISNYVNHIANTPLDDISKPYAWKKPEHLSH